MFTGIIESLGEVKELYETGTNRTFWIQSPLSHLFTVDQSVAHDGACLTVEEVAGNRHRVTAVLETLEKTALRQWVPGRVVNLEQSLLPSRRLDGHFVQGHVDTTGTCEKIEDKSGSYELTFSFPAEFAPLVIEKGSIAVNGTSLTIFNIERERFKVALIPYTWQHTNLHTLEKGAAVNLEFDLLGKYINRYLQLNH